MKERDISFWTSLSGIVTAIATLITAIAGLATVTRETPVSSNPPEFEGDVIIIVTLIAIGITAISTVVAYAYKSMTSKSPKSLAERRVI